MCVRGGSNILYMASFDLTSWDKVTTPTRSYALSTYHSQLVLVGGVESGKEDYNITNKLWTSDTGFNWQQSLPPMPTKRFFPSAINTETPEYLVVAGGIGAGISGGVEIISADVVEVLVDETWFGVSHLPAPCLYSNFALHNGTLYLKHKLSMYYLEVNNLFDSLNWGSLQFVRKFCFPTSFGQQLIVVYDDIFSITHSSITPTWFPVGKTPCKGLTAAPVVLPMGELVVMGFNGVFKGSLRGRALSSLSFPIFLENVLTLFYIVSPYDPDSRFTMNSLYRLEAMGINVVSPLAEVNPEMISVAGISLDMPSQEGMSKTSCLELVIEKWENGFSHLPPTWRSLMRVLKELHLNDMNQQIEDCLLGKFC